MGEEIVPSNHEWTTALPEATLAEINQLIKPAKEARERSDAEPARLLVAEATRRSYHFDKDQGLYVEMVLTKGHGLIRVGWSGGVLFAKFSGPKVYSYPLGTEEQFRNLTNSPYPDRLWKGYSKKFKEAADA